MRFIHFRYGFRRLLLLGLVVFSTFSLQAQAPEFRAYWADAFHAGFMNSNEVAKLVQDTRNGNFNAIIVEVRKRGDAYYNSRFEPKATNISPPEYDPLADLIAQAHDLNAGPRIEVHAWLVTYHVWNPSTADGVPPQPDHPYNLHPDWVMKDINGNSYLGGQYTFDQGHPGVQQHTFNVCMDIVTNYDVDGINFDYVRYSGTSEGYNDVTVARFNELHGRSGIPAPADAAWKQFRRDQVSALVRKVYLNTMAVKPHVKVSADTICFAPGVTNLAQWYSSSAAWNSVLQDWRGWLEEGMVDMAIPMAYFRQHTVNASDWAKWNLFCKDFRYNRHIVPGPGIYLNSISNSIYQMRSTRELSPSGHRADGVSLYSYAVNSTNSPPLPIEDWHAALTIAPNAYDTNTTAIFAEPVPPPAMPWKTHPTRGHIKGFVYRTTTNAIFDGATVTLSGAVSKTVTNDATGFYGYVDLPPGNYTLRATGPGFGAQSKNVNVMAGQVTDADFVIIDDRPPLIFNVQATNLTDTAATLRWNTDEPADSFLEFGRTTAYGTTWTNAALEKSHAVALTNFEACTIYHFRLRARDALGYETVSPDYAFSTLRAGIVPDLIVDNLAAQVTGTWSSGSGATDKYGVDYRFKSAGSGAASLQFIPNLHVAGNYEVLEWHSQGSNRSTNAPHIINFAGGTSTQFVNQQSGGGQWNSLGIYPFAAGSNGGVAITDQFADVGQVVMADALRWVYVPPPDEIIITAPEAQYYGSWTASSAGSSQYSNHYFYAVTKSSPPFSEAYFVPSIPARKKYNVYLWYSAGVNRATNVSVYVSHHGGAISTNINQTTGGGEWRIIASACEFAAGQAGYVHLSNYAGETNKIIIADAVRFLPVEKPCVLTHPLSQTISHGSTASFVVEVESSQPVKYQWQFNGSPIPGATENTFTKTNASIFDAGDYLLLMTNALGWSVTFPAHLTVDFLVPPQNTAISRGTNHHIYLQWQGDAGRYAIEASTNLLNWGQVDLVTNTTGVFFYIDSDAAAARRFYRSRLLP